MQYGVHLVCRVVNGRTLCLEVLRDFLTSGPLVALVVEGERAIEAVRRLNGATDALAAEPGSIRGDWSVSGRENLVHGSDSPASAIREITLWFPGLR